MAQHYRFTTFLLDEVHYLPGANGFLKRIYDFLQVRVIFTSSVALEMEASAHDLARRVRLYRLDYFSFREYLEFRQGERLERLGLDDLLAENIPPEHLRAGTHFVKYISGGLLPFSIEEPDPLPLDEIDLLRKMLRFISRSPVDGINYSTLSANLGITKYKAEQYAAAFESAFVLQRVFPAGMNVVREPKVLLVPPARLLEGPLDEVIGALREEFFALAMRQAGLELRYLKSTRGQKTPDFLLVHKGERIAMEIGGKGKGRSQFKGVTADRKIVLGQDIAPAPGRIPLHLAGFLA
ncbi:MAG: AAA family ATPase [Oceanipulchritudo sp.]